MRKKEAEIIVMRYIFGWASVLLDVEEDFYDYIPPNYMTKSKPEQPNKHYSNEYEAKPEERQMMRAIAQKEVDRIIRRLRKLQPEEFK